MTEWWTGLAPAEALVECEGHRHRLRWSRGVLTAVDHDDPESERALAAISGTPCPCIEALDAWTAHATDLRVLVLAPRGPFEGLVPQQGRPRRVAGYTSSSVRATAAMMTAKAPVWGTNAPSQGRTVYQGARPMRPGVPGAITPSGALQAANEAEPLIRLLYLDGGLADRLIATVAAHWSARLDAAATGTQDPELALARPALTAALYGRAAGALRTWLRNDDLRVTVTMIDRQGDPSFFRAEDGVAVALPFCWLSDVWSRGMATVLDRFCLSATIAARGDRIRWDLVTVGPEGNTAPVSIEGPA